MSCVAMTAATFSGCGFDENAPDEGSYISWHQNDDGVTYGKTCIGKDMYAVTTSTHNYKNLSGIIGSCSVDDIVTWKPHKEMELTLKWKTSKSGIRHAFTCIENKVFIVTPSTHSHNYLALVGDDCSKIPVMRLQ